MMDVDTKEKTPPKFVMRIDLNIKSLSRWGRVFQTQYESAKSKEDYSSRTKAALEFSEDGDLEEEVVDNMDPLARKLLWLLAKHYTKRHSASFSIKEQFSALAVLKQSPNTYRFLQKMFILPSNAALKELIRNQNFHAGINTHFFSFMEKRVANWSNVERLCVVLFGIRHLSPENVCIYRGYNIKEDLVKSNDKINHPAKYALVFMLRGAEYKWQLPIAFYLSEGRPCNLQLRSRITKVICAISQTGLKPIALIPDHIAIFQPVIDDLLADSKRDQFLSGQKFDHSIHLGGNSLGVFYDPYRLRKEISRLFGAYDVDFGGDRISWRDIVQHFESATKDTSQNFTSEFKKYLADRPVDRAQDFVALIQDLLESMDMAGKDKTSLKKPLRRAITRKSKHHAFWEEAIKKLETTTFFNNENERVNTPCINNWIITIRSFQRAWELLKSHKVKVMRNQNFGQGPVHETYDQMRRDMSKGCPTISYFINGFKLMFMTSFLSDKGQINPIYLEYYLNSIETQQK